MTDHTRLRELAQNATPGPWHIDPVETGEYALCVYHDRHDGYASHLVANRLTKTDAEYLGAVQPETVLDLLTELEDTRAAYQLTRHQLDAHRAGQGTYEGITR